ncbi:MAG: hypothetical protein ACLRM9_00185 [Collinsella aerofaciens]
MWPISSWLALCCRSRCDRVIGAFWNLIIATGMHVPIYTAILPAALQNGYDAILYPGTAVVAYTTLAIALAYGLRAKDKESEPRAELVHHLCLRSRE